MLPIAALIYILFFRKKQVAVQPARNLDDLTPSDIIAESLKIPMSYDEALEASKQFIYNIIKLVVQKFTPSDMEILSAQGKILIAHGVQYQHVVDIEALQYQKFVQSRRQQTQAGTSRAA